jgi:cyclopropane fatty-acyl-phospholipid synthase-like methyltransferase
MNPNKALWEKGDFTRIAETMRESGEALVGKFGITQGLKVLDLGCGDGTTAIPAAPEPRETAADALAVSGRRLSYLLMLWGAVAIAYVVAKALLA